MDSFKTEVISKLSESSLISISGRKMCGQLGLRFVSIKARNSVWSNAFQMYLSHLYMCKINDFFV